MSGAAEALRRIVRSLPGYPALRRGLNYLADPTYRSLINLGLFQGDTAFQLSGVTAADRYPEAFAYVAGRLREREAPTLLSFGCSTGEEVSSIRAALPKARIVGLDVNRRSIAIARRRIADPAVTLIAGADVRSFEDGAFDAIFCMAVLQRSILNVERPSSCASILTFDRFEEAIVGLDRVLKLGGVLVLHRTNFRFGDTVAAARYAPRQGLPPGIPSTAKYDRDNHLIPDQWDEPISIFEKVG
jgi:SAM-dependent methyltransferase